MNMKYYMEIHGYSDTPQKICPLLRFNGIPYEFVDYDLYENAVCIGIMPSEKWHKALLNQISNAMLQNGIRNTMYYVRARKYINGR